MKEILLISFRAGEAAGRELQAGEAERFGGAAHAGDGFFMQLGVAHDAAFADVSAFQFELRLNEDDKVSTGFAACNGARKNLGHGDEGNVGDDEGDRLGKIAGRKIAGIFLDEENTRIFAQFPSNLIRIDVHGVDTRGALLEQAISEAAGGGAHIETNSSQRADAKIFQCALQLKTTPAGIFLQAAADFEESVWCDRLAGLFSAIGAHRDLAREDHGLGFLAGFGQATLDEKKVEALAWGFRRHFVF